jgi:hypothetical protein
MPSELSGRASGIGLDEDSAVADGGFDGVVKGTGSVSTRRRLEEGSSVCGSNLRRE